MTLNAKAPRNGDIIEMGPITGPETRLGRALCPANGIQIDLNTAESFHAQMDSILSHKAIEQYKVFTDIAS